MIAVLLEKYEKSHTKKIGFLNPVGKNMCYIVTYFDKTIHPFAQKDQHIFLLFSVTQVR